MVTANARSQANFEKYIMFRNRTNRLKVRSIKLSILVVFDYFIAK